MNPFLSRFKKVVGGFASFSPSEFQKDIDAHRAKMRERPVFKHLIEGHNREPWVLHTDKELDAWHANLHAVGGHEDGE
jgi:hypothetical protein